jgi:hypothetical protein
VWEKVEGASVGHAAGRPLGFAAAASDGGARAEHKSWRRLGARGKGTTGPL